MFTHRINNTGLYADEQLLLPRDRLVDFDFVSGVDLTTVKVVMLSSGDDKEDARTAQWIRTEFERSCTGVTVEILRPVPVPPLGR